jgi:branched-chain amino acid transport system ATP-binding protein
MLRIDDLHVNYGAIEAVRGVALEVQPGKVTLVLGANGAGKTTTLKAVAGLQPPHRGTVVLDGKDITGMSAHKVVARGVALVPGGLGVYAQLGVAENLHIGGYTAGRAV